MKSILKSNLTRFIIINNFLGSLAIIFFLYETFDTNMAKILSSIYFIISIFSSAYFIAELGELQNAYDFYLKKEQQERK